MDTRTVAALDAITAFAVPNSNCSSQNQSVFSGLVASSGHPAEQIAQPTSDWQGLFRQSFQPPMQQNGIVEKGPVRVHSACELIIRLPDVLQPAART